MNVIDASSVTAEGQGLGLVPVNSPTQFEVRTNQIGAGADATIKITSPSQRTVPCSVIERAGGNYQVEYTPNEVGPYRIDVRYADLPIPGTPFTSKAFDIHAIRVGAIPPGIVGRAVEFQSK